jgi:hypothetical protein
MRFWLLPHYTRHRGKRLRRRACIAVHEEVNLGIRTPRGHGLMNKHVPRIAFVTELD